MRYKRSIGLLILFFILNGGFSAVSAKDITSKRQLEVEKNNIIQKYVAESIFSELLGLNIHWYEKEYKIKIAGFLKLNSTRNIEALFPRSIVRGSITKDAVLYDGINGKQTGMLKAETPLEILADKAYKWYRVRSNDGKEGWVRVENIYIEKVFKKNNDAVSNSEIEQYVKYKGWTSPTEYLLWTDISRQKLYILKNGSGWYVDTIMDCSTGENISPTVQGEFSVMAEKGKWLNTGGGTGARYYTRFFGSYYFHSIKLSNRGKVLDGTLGMPASMGCIRLSVENSKWLQDSIPAGTKLYIY